MAEVGSHQEKKNHMATYMWNYRYKQFQGCLVVYSEGQKRFFLPSEYLSNEIIREQLNIAEDKFGLPVNGPLILPCDSEFMEYAIDLIKQRVVTGDVERALLTSIASCNSSSLYFHFHHQIPSHQLKICSF